MLASDRSYSIYLLLTALSGTFSSEDPQQVRGKPGDDVTLDCIVPTHTPIEVLKWIRPDLKLEGFVLFYRDRVVMASYQHPSFVDRVELRDPGMKDGDVSVILKNVTVNDTGSYESHVLLSGTGSSELRCIIHLSIEDSGDAHEDVWYRQITTLHILYTVIPVAVALVSLTVIVVAIKKCRGGQKAERAETQVQHDLSQEVHWPKVKTSAEEQKMQRLHVETPEG